MQIERLLNKIFNSVQYSPDGSIHSIKKKVGQVNHIRFYIHSNDHLPPHFHVYDKSKNLDASFRIDNCDLYKGEASKKHIKVIEYFYSVSKSMIVDEWNTLHPDKKIVLKE
ncbi:MAG: DUF4160 domain-containing protein [Flavobacteriales bacterium]|nr:DUF4160 domain-containing protein [Flavobacteriales bacterium]